ncbi:flagellar hook capping FlgD N-terminal domain-containing protein [Nocardioides pantholopis]|uniref:flagellar hook capping FlgD N-terminal domain-containing protein n=1 Tax=Nocardioides pantholopis TaxID=2483798 RepID=UPI000F08E6DE|nr:flagellar hook capping FlgD N-terminal domain-containing protein [Nocardioides pantholopis]
MSISATEGVTPSSVFTTTPAQAASGSKDQDMFLQLLMAQMKYQDPMNPADSGEFLSQNAQFTALEKMQEVADQTSLLLNVTLAFGATSMVGRTVSYTAADGTTATGAVSAVSFGASGPLLDVNGTEVPMVSVLKVTDGSTGSTNATGSTGSTGI